MTKNTALESKGDVIDIDKAVQEQKQALDTAVGDEIVLHKAERE